MSTKYVTHLLAKDVVLFIRNNDSSNHSNVYISTLRKCGNKILTLYGDELNSMKHLNINSENYETIFVSIIKESLEPKFMNWGRIAAVYVFAGWYVKYLAGKGIRGIECNISNLLAHYILLNCENWIENQGGWDNFVLMFADNNLSLLRKCYEKLHDKYLDLLFIISIQFLFTWFIVHTFKY